MMRRVPKIAGLVGICACLSLLLACALIPSEAQGKRKPRVAKRKKEIVMLTDQEIKDALKAESAIALVKTDAIEVEAPGTRGHQTFYKLTIAQSLEGTLTGTVDAARYGAPVLQQGQMAIVVLGGAAGGEHRLEAFVVVPDGKQTEVVPAHLERIAKLKTTR